MHEIEYLGEMNVMCKVVILLLYLLLLSIYDIRGLRVPALLLTIGCIGIGINAVWELCTGQQTLLQSMLGVIPGILFLVIAWVSGKAGYADGIILIWIGIMCGYRDSFLVLAASLMLASTISIILLMLRKVNRQSRIPYIPFLAAGLGIVLL